MSPAEAPRHDPVPPPAPPLVSPDEIMARRLETLPFAAVVLALAVAVGAGLDHRLTLEALRADAAPMAAWAAGHPLLAPLASVLAAAATAAIALPGAALIATASGLMMGTIGGAFTATLGATLGSAALMLAARMAIRPVLRRRDAPLLLRAEQAVQRDGFVWMLALRLLLPFAPFAATLIAAALGARLKPFLLSTALGTVPAAVVLAYDGAALGRGEAVAANPLLGWPFLALSLGLALLALSPIIWRRKVRTG